MPRLPAYNPKEPDAQAIAEHHYEEMRAGLDRVGPEFDSDEAELQDAAVRAAGATAYFHFEEADGE